MDASWEELSSLSAAKKKVLEDALALEIRKDKLRLSFANQANDYLLWAKETSDQAAQTHFGFTLAEVSSFDIKKADETTLAQSASKTEAHKQTYAEMTGLGVTDNVYTKVTPADLEKAVEQLSAALQARRQRCADFMRCATTESRRALSQLRCRARQAAGARRAVPRVRWRRRSLQQGDRCRQGQDHQEPGRPREPGCARQPAHRCRLGRQQPRAQDTAHHQGGFNDLHCAVN